MIVAQYWILARNIDVLSLVRRAVHMFMSCHVGNAKVVVQHTH